MSLQIWLPFNGTDKNQGLYNDLIYTGDITYSDNGKIGKCKSGGLSIKANKNPMELEGTIAFWIYVDENTATGQLFGNNSTTVGTDNRKWSLYLYPNRNSIHSWGCMLDDSTSSGNGSFTVNNIIPDETWTHIAVSHDNTNQYIYVNGELNQTIKWNNLTGTLTFDVETQIIYQNNGVLFNDFRIYDECLNKKQIKELAKGLVAHYKLSRPIDNLIPDTYTMSSIGGSGTLLKEKYHDFGIKGLILTSSSTGSYADNITRNSFITPNAGEYYTCSFWAKGNTPIFNFFYPECCDKVINCQGYSSTAIDGNNRIQLTEEWKYYWMIFRTKSGVTGAKNIVMGRIQPVSDGKYCYIAGLKFEKGYNIAPEWTPHPDDTEYYTYGYNTNIEKDVSGNGYDLEYSKIYPEIDNDSAIHKTSFKFTQGLESTNSGIQYLSRPYFDFLTNTFTISCWVKLNSENTYSGGTEIARQYIISQGRDTGNVGFNIAYQDSKIQAFYGVDTSNNRRLLSTDTISLFIWYHIVVTWDGSNLVLYINGVKNSEGSLSGVDYSQCSDRFVIGKMAYLYTGTATYFPFVGDISDVRIYSTTLSETDIKELYNIRASLDKNGNYYTSDIVEE